MSAAAPLSLWDASAEETDPQNAFTPGGTTDLAIVGGGFTGLSTALHAAERGIACHVLEANRIGHGGSGRNAGLVNPGLWLPPAEVQKRLGRDRGRALVETLGAAPDYVFSLIEKYQIRCEATRQGTIHAAHSPGAMAGLRQRAEAWAELGTPVELLSRDQATAMIGSPAFHGGLFDRRAGTINPMGYARGLARAATAAGATLSTGVRVRRLERHGDTLTLRTDQGPLFARTVVLGTNAFTDGLWPGLRDTFTTIDFFKLATEPLGERAAGILPGGQGIWDTGLVMFALRRDAHGRLLIGSMGRAIGGTSGLTARWASRTLARLFPDLGPVRFEEAWDGPLAMTPDHLPRIHRLADGLYTPIGYNGRGITTGTIFGKAMAELAGSDAEDDLLLPISAPRRIAGATLKSGLYRAAFAANQFWQTV